MMILADTKIVDGGKLECEDACKAGADIVTVLAVADNATVRGVVDTAHRYGRRAMGRPDPGAGYCAKGAGPRCAWRGLCVRAYRGCVQSQDRTPLKDLRTPWPPSFL